jgi:hypothetical protein
MCELSLDPSASVYELRTADLTGSARVRVEQFGDVTPAFLRQAQIEADLIATGWGLDLYERRPPILH